MADAAALKLELEQLRSECAISEKLESKARERQLELQSEVSNLRAESEILQRKLEGKVALEQKVESLEKEINRLRESSPDPKQFKETSKLVVSLQEENDKLKQELREVTNNSRHGESHFALEYAMTRDEQLKELAKKNFELFNSLNNCKEDVERSRQDVNDLSTQLYKKKVRCKELHKVITKERDRRSKAEHETERLKEKVAALTKHIEKLMVALRLHAQAQAKTNEEKQQKAKQLKKATKKVNLTKNKAFLSSRVIAQLRQQVDMLTGQLRLADDRYGELRSVIDVERRTSQANLKRITRDLQNRAASDEQSKEWMMQQQKALEKAQSDIGKRRLADEKRLAKQKEELTWKIQEAQEKQLAAEAETKKMAKMLEKKSMSPSGKGGAASMPNLHMSVDVGAYQEQSIQMYGSLPPIGSIVGGDGDAGPGLSLSEEAKVAREEEREERLQLFKEQQRAKEQEKTNDYFWRHKKAVQ